ncbi:hypothetical protein Forpe1208_v017030 [Fusarium oxysporum f. sp. rapae]|uniref:Uncharacterized protein n=1 Tax=Fusarium oxysporum f. sp. rapae TaxID=485398 RepID=A0A8J5NG65_FUSOX|nr:hypothetical protein Forpe1208_v017030 [Fusarium oxysporum f. sp. rapae]
MDAHTTGLQAIDHTDRLRQWLELSSGDFIWQVRTYTTGKDLNCFLDRKAYITICRGIGDNYDKYVSWEEVTELTNFIFQEKMFGEEEEEDWQGAGRLFVALCFIRADRESDPEHSFSLLEQFIDPRAIRQVTAAHYLDYALRCFNAGLSFKGIRMGDQRWLKCIRDQWICPYFARIMEGAASKMYKQQHDQADETTGGPVKLEERAGERFRSEGR